MIFLIIAILVVGTLIAVPATTLLSQRRKQLAEFGYPRKLTDELSNPSRLILKNLQNIPVANRPQGDMYRVVAALDKKYGGSSKVNTHYTTNQEYPYRNAFDWNEHDRKDGCTLHERGDKYTGQCAMPEYKNIKFNLQEIEKALGEQEYALEMAGLSGDVEMATSMIEQMKAERETIKYVTEGLTNKELS